MLKGLWAFIQKHISHKGLREIATTLNHFNFIEIAVIGLFCFFAWDLLTWYKAIMTIEAFNGVAFWGAMGAIVAAIFSALKSMGDTLKNKQ